MKNILLSAKYFALQEKSTEITLLHVKQALLTNDMTDEIEKKLSA